MREVLIFAGILIVWTLVYRWFMLRAQLRRDENDAIYLEESTKELEAKNEPITIAWLENQDFDRYETKSQTHLIRGRVSVVFHPGGIWEVSINDGKGTWRDTMENVGQMEYFCSKHNINLIEK